MLVCSRVEDLKGPMLTFFKKYREGPVSMGAIGRRATNVLHFSEHYSGSALVSALLQIACSLVCPTVRHAFAMGH